MAAEAIYNSTEGRAARFLRDGCATRKSGRSLTARSVETERVPGLYADTLARGLYLQVTTGVAGPTRSYKFRFRSPTGRRRDMGMGAAADVSLADARNAAHECRRLLALGRDPLDDAGPDRVRGRGCECEKVRGESSADALRSEGIG